MKYYNPIFLLLIAVPFLSASLDQNRNYTTETIISADTTIYDVKFSFTGYQSFNGDLTDCPVRPSGTVVLKGLLKGIENVRPSDDVVYIGILQLDIDIDICSVKGKGDNAKPCGITVTGSGPVTTQLEIYYAGRGGYIQIKDTTSGGFRKNAGGTCEQGEINEERTMIPLKTIATIFNGLDLPMLTNRTLTNKSDSLRTSEGMLKVQVRKIR